jgi:hypothetical protein
MSDPSKMKGVSELLALSPKDLIAQLDADLKEMKERDSAGKLKRFTKEFDEEMSDAFGKSQKVMNLAGRELSKMAFDQARAADRGKRVLEAMDRITEGDAGPGDDKE